MSRTAIFVAALSGAVVALALVAQATDFGSGFVAFALVLLPVVYFLGIVTVIRLSQVNHEDARWMQGMNRIRNAYLELEPSLERYFVTSRYDDLAGVRQSSVAMSASPSRMQGFVAVPGIVAVLDSAVAGSTAGIAGIGLNAGTGVALAVGAVVFALSATGFAVFARRAIERYIVTLDPAFPGPGSS